MNHKMILCVLAAALGGCSTPPRQVGVDPQILAEVEARAPKQPAPPAAVNQALLPPLRMEMPDLSGRPLDGRFDLSVSGAPAAQVFMSLASGTRYSMLVHPNVSGSISMNLKDVTIREALDAIRQLYGYEYRIEGTRIFVQPAGLQTRIFQVNYLPGQRRGFSDVRVQSGAVTDSGVATASTASPVPVTGAPQGSRSLESSRVTTQQSSDFWADLRAALLAIVGTAEGRSIVVTPHSGVVVVRALPGELRAVDEYLRATRVSVERQVMLEAKIVEVTLSDSFQSGINWAAFFEDRFSVGQAGSGTLLQPGRGGNRLQATGAGSITDTLVTGAAVSSRAGRDLINHSATGPVFGLALATPNFAALLTFLESQGNVQVLSSPRIATINNTKAVLKVGTDEFFVTNVTTTATTSGTSTTQSPSVTVQPFFSGIVLDVTPQIDENNAIILHIHPSVSEVTESTRVVNLGGDIAEIRLPLARSTVSETDTVVRATDGNIVAIGGLMSVDIRDNRNGLPGMSDDNPLRNTQRSRVKKELVILLKPTIIESELDWQRDVREARQRLEGLR
ncbi:MAG TPA: secretin N-terminal domain-containing protein [Burkholderiales bacterium]